MWNILNLLIITTSFLIIPSCLDIFWLPKNIAFVILGFSFIGYSMIDDRALKINEFKNKWIGAILIYAILNFSLAYFKPIIFPINNQAVFNIWNYLPTLNIILGIVLIKLLVEYSDISRWVRISELLCWICFIFSAYAILQFFRLDQIFNRVNYQWNDNKYMVTFLGNNMLSGNFIAMLSPLCLMFNKLRYKLFYAIAFISVMLTTSAISILSFIIGFLVYLIFTKRVKLAVCISLYCLLLVILLYNFKPYLISDNGRFELWGKALLKYKDMAFTGYGIGSFAMQRFPGYCLPKGYWHTAHCEFIQIPFEGGIFLFILVIGYLIGLIKRIFEKEASILFIGYVCAFSSFLVTCFGGFPLRIASTALIGILYISALETQLIKEN